MFDYQFHFDAYCREHSLFLSLSFSMPERYGSANGTFDAETGTVFVNAGLLADRPDYEKAFFLFHELRHALQQRCPEQFSELVRRSAQYVIQYDGTCYKLAGGQYLECRLEGSEETFTGLYLGQPYEADANRSAYEQVRRLYGDPDGLEELYSFWMPGDPVPDEAYEEIYRLIDEKAK